MTNLINCTECGALFVGEDGTVCKRCEEALNNKLNVIVRQLMMSAEPVKLAIILDEHGLEFDKFEKLFTARKLLRIADKLIINCNSCHKEMLAEGRYNFLCPECSSRIEKAIFTS